MAETPHVLIVGGGVVGTGLARDLALRGVDVTLLEKGSLAAGATGRMHGLLHSGARYAVSDPESATQCIQENRILREIAGHCVDRTEGLFVDHPEDPSGYFERKRRACEECSIPTTELQGLGEREPALSAEIDRALSVPDGVVDPFALTAANAVAAENQGATLRTGAEVTGLLREGDTVGGVEVAGDGPDRRRADYVVNATGAWADRLAEQAGVEIPIRLSKGAMVVVESRPTESVINRCRPRSEADILVPYGERAILGTTDVEVDDPDAFERDGSEQRRIVDGLSAVVPSLSRAAVRRTYWGVRPLYSPAAETGETTEVTRDFVVLDHRRDGLEGLATVIGGKLTTYRHVAERAADHVCAQIGIDSRCRTAERPLPGAEDGVLERARERFGLGSLTEA